MDHHFTTKAGDRVVATMEDGRGGLVFAIREDRSADGMGWHGAVLLACYPEHVTRSLLDMFTDADVSTIASTFDLPNL